MIKSNSFRKVTVQTSFFIIETDKLLLIRFLPKRLILFLTSYNLQTNSFINMKSKLFSAKTGKLKCQVAKYDHLFQITLPLSNTVMCLMSTELNVDPFKIAERVTEIKNKYFE